LPDATARRWVVSGRVQGVGFRWYVQGRASRLGLAGWVRNLDDGSVEVVATGDQPSLASLDEIVRQGPPGARVTAVTTADVPHEVVDTKSFNIKG
jgi:acylphosphatase